MTKLCYCKDCNSHNSWVRCPGRDWITESGKIFEFAYKCSVCGRITLRPEEADGNG